jgi:hypothetical protein
LAGRAGVRELKHWIHMQTTVLPAFVHDSPTVLAMLGAGVVILVVALWTARTDLAQARGVEKCVALSNLCFALPIGVFGALHVAGVELVLPGVPEYMPWRLFWAYLVGVALLAASLSVATKIEVRWSGLLFGIMMFLFVAMLDLPGAVATPKDRFGWTLALRELAFGGGGWVLAGRAMRSRGGSRLIAVGRALISTAAIFFAVMTFVHPAGRPGVPLNKLTPEWIPGRVIIGYLTAVFLLVGGIGMLFGKRKRAAAAYLGAWIVLLVVLVYGPILVAALMNPSAAAQIEGINFFADTLFFGGAILALASATPLGE